MRRNSGDSLRIPAKDSRRQTRKAFSTALKEVRNRNGIAKAPWRAAGIDRSYLDRLERGLHGPGLSLLCQLSRGLGMTPTEFTVEIERYLPAEGLDSLGLESKGTIFLQGEFS